MVAGSAVGAPRTIIGVMGGGQCDPATYAAARQLGRELAQAGYVVLCGGRTGVMEAAARGAREGGGLTIGILPGRDAMESPPNPYIDLPIFTGLSYARNVVNVLSARVIVALGGGVGTLSEIALALNHGKPVVLLDSWRFEIAGYREPDTLHRVGSVSEAVRRVRELAPAGRS